MKKLVYALVYYSIAPFLYFFSILPWPVLLLVSDISFILLYYIFGYRKDVVMRNLKNSFPEKTEYELKKIRFRFYRYFTDMVFESLKLITMSQEQKVARCKMDSDTLELLEDLHTKGRSGILVMGHYGNWEYCPSGLPPQIEFQSYVIYHPLSNPYFDRIMARIRISTSCKLYTMKETLKGMMANRNELNLTAVLSDQTPSSKGAYWTQFMNQDTAVFNGTEKIAQKLGMAVIYGCMERVKRGKYIYHTTLICDDASQTMPGEITERHVRLLEADIRNAPEFWLWTHRRWKHKRENKVETEL